IGRGGMGVVYEALQVSLGRHVALKLLPPTARLAPTFLERFRREARAVARLHHTNIVPVFGVGEAEGGHFYAMQYIRRQGLDPVGADLRRLRGGKAAPSEACAAAHSLLSGQFAPPEGAAAPAADAAPSALSGTHTGAVYYRSVARLGQQAA